MIGFIGVKKKQQQQTTLEAILDVLKVPVSWQKNIELIPPTNVTNTNFYAHFLNVRCGP